MITTKQRAALRGMANGIDTIVQIGKGGIGPHVLTQADDALTARELIKLRVLPGCELSAREAADALAAPLRAEVVQVIGTRFILYRNNPKKNLIKL